MDMDEDEFEDEFADFEREVAKEKKKTVVNPNKNINQAQINKGQMNIYDDDFDVNKLWFLMFFDGIHVFGWRENWLRYF